MCNSVSHTHLKVGAQKNTVVGPKIKIIENVYMVLIINYYQITSVNFIGNIVLALRVGYIAFFLIENILVGI